MLKRSILNTLVQISGKVVTVLISLVTTGILTRKLGVSVYGSFTLITSVFLLLDALADFGTKTIGVRELSSVENKKREGMFTQMVWLRLIMTAIAFLIGVLFILLSNSFAGVKLEAFVCLLMIWFTAIAGSLEIVFQTRLRMDLKVIIEILFPLLFLITLIIWPSVITLLWVFTAYLIARIISLNIGFFVFNRWNDFNFSFFKSKIDINIVKKLLSESWPMGVYLIVFTSYDRAVDSLMIKHFIGVAEVAWYGLAYKVYISLIQPAYYFVNSIFPLLSSKMEKKNELFKRSFWILFGGILLVIPVIYFMAPWIIQVLAGSEFGMSVTVLRILLIALVFSYIGHLVGFTLISKKGQKDLLLLGVVVLIVNIGANLWAIPRFGIIGAAWVTGLSEAVGCGLMVWRLRRTKQ